MQDRYKIRREEKTEGGMKNNGMNRQEDAHFCALVYEITEAERPCNLLSVNNMQLKQGSLNSLLFGIISQNIPTKIRLIPI